MCSNYSLIICPRFLQPFTALPEGWALKALRSRISSSGTSRGPAVDVFNFGGGRCRTLPPAPHGAHHRRLQLRRWPLSDLAASTPGARHRRLQLLNLQLRHLPMARRRHFYVDGGRSRAFNSSTSQGSTVDIFTLMVGASGPSTPAPPGGTPSTFSH
jgi:hypothetical protein